MYFSPSPTHAWCDWLAACIPLYFSLVTVSSVFRHRSCQSLSSVRAVASISTTNGQAARGERRLGPPAAIATALLLRDAAQISRLRFTTPRNRRLRNVSRRVSRQFAHDGIRRPNSGQHGAQARCAALRGREHGSPATLRTFVAAARCTQISDETNSGTRAGCV